MDTMTDVGVVVTGGVDTHKDLHVAAAIDQFGRLLGTEEFPTNSAGYADLHAWLAGFGALESVGVEGTGAWGAGLTRYLRCNGVTVVEVSRPNRQGRRLKGKSDTLDAEAAGRAVQSGEAAAFQRGAKGRLKPSGSCGWPGDLQSRHEPKQPIRSIRSSTPVPKIYGAVSLGSVRRPRSPRPLGSARGDADTPKGAAKTALASLARR